MVVNNTTTVRLLVREESKYCTCILLKECFTELDAAHARPGDEQKTEKYMSKFNSGGVNLGHGNGQTLL